ncbi:MAG: hypothetical protein CSA25_03770 [Desulfobacter postgatei]|uniref:Uncharacterized protein n=1 Tax=Desulfobacter postgatei TaxID=2293 RepID=A0A2G6MRY3_9BACT|nr:MAG: hypothetical protein CSA25_03770 [Desulfobacter postgatei]
MIRIKAPKAAPGFKSPSRHANGRIFDICVRWRNAEGSLIDKQMGVFILIMGLRACLIIDFVLSMTRNQVKCSEFWMPPETPHLELLPGRSLHRPMVKIR